MDNPTREDAFNLLKEFTKSDSLIKHGLSVEGVMRYFAKKHNEDVEKWGIVGLIHDHDYEMYPEEHCVKAREIMEERGWPEEYIRAVQSHGYGLCVDVKPETLLEKTLYAIDELTGLITATALVRPSKSIMDVKVKSVKKKWKAKQFSAGVDRSIIEKGAADLGVELADLINDTILGMREVADEIGLKGPSTSSHSTGSGTTGTEE
ncbi:MAG: hydrolase [Spirochaetes bacterium]|nr:MAG: hydrolase [Spirochaetota bacterium]